MHMLQAKLAALAEVFVDHGPWDYEDSPRERNICRYCHVHFLVGRGEPEPKHDAGCLWRLCREVLDKLGKNRLEAKLHEVDDLAELRDLALYMRKFADNIEVQISTNAEAESLRGWAGILSEEGNEDEARLLRDAAAIVEGL